MMKQRAAGLIHTVAYSTAYTPIPSIDDRMSVAQRSFCQNRDMWFACCPVNGWLALLPLEHSSQNDDVPLLY